MTAILSLSFHRSLIHAGALRAVATAIVLALAVCLVPAPLLAEDADSRAAADSGDASSPKKADETVVVTSKRLPDGAAPKNEIPANVTVLTREAIERTGARDPCRTFWRSRPAS